MALATFLASTLVTPIQAQNQEYWREGFQPEAGCDLTTTNPTTAVAYYFNGQAGVWYGANLYRTTGTGCPSGNAHVRYKNIAGVTDSGFLITPVVNFGIKELHFLRARATRSHSIYTTPDTSALTSNWTLVATTPSSAATAICVDTTIMINSATAKRLKIVSRPLTDTDIDSVYITSFNIIVPIKFGGINAVQTNGQVKVSWNIATEINSLRYDIERSADGRSFSVVGSVSATNATKYSFIDYSPTGSDNYYRIKGIDKDGSIIYSSIVRINSNKKSPELTIQPNPIVSGKLNLQLSNFEKGMYTVSLFSNAGLKVFNSTINNEAGSSTTSLQIPSSVQPGVYKLMVINGKNKISKSVVVQ